MRTWSWIAVVVMALVIRADGQSLFLAGQWRFQLDREDKGIADAWFKRALPDTAKLPGTLAEQGIGDAPSIETKWTGGIQKPDWFKQPELAQYAEPGDFKFPYWLTPEKYYAGAAWFQRDIEIPTNWAGRRVVLFLERAHWETRVWVDGRCVGTNNSLSTPHEYELGIVSDGIAKHRSERSDAPRSELAPGKHTVSIRVDNRRIVDIGENSHAITDHTQGNWNGIVGKIELRATPQVWIEDFQVYPDLATKSVKVKGRIGNATGKAGEGRIGLDSYDRGLEDRPPFERNWSNVLWDTNGGSFEAELPKSFQATRLWDEFGSSTYYEAHLWLNRGEDRKSVSFALREVSTSGTQLTINGQKTFIRGTLECCIFPKTGHPPMDVEEWRRIIRVAKSYGLNLIRFHSYCPPEAAFQAADELGMYFQIETCWPNGGSANIGDGRPVDQWIYDETDRILKYYGNHPSFVLMAHGNEPGGGKANAFLAKYVEHYKAKDPRRLWSSGSGWPQLPENQFHVTPDPRIQAWGGGLKSRINAKPPETTTDYRDYIAARKVPVISHEIGQWCAYPNFDEIPKYTGYLKPKNFEIFRDRLEANGMGKLAKQFLLASGKLQTLCYKEDIESALRTPGMGGFELLDLHDFPGQGTALVGVLDPFWEEKGYVTAAEYSRFCNSTVPLARLKKRVFTTDETLEAEIELAHNGSHALGRPLVMWRLVDDFWTPVASGRITPEPLAVGTVHLVGKVEVGLTNLIAPKHYRLVVQIADRSDARTVRSKPDARMPAIPLYENDWDIWVYPAMPATGPAKDILVTAQFDDAAQKHVASGGKLLLTLPGKAVRNFDTDPVKLGFSSIFWNTAWTKRQAPTTLGILCDPKHPALAEFSTEFHSNWQWWYLIHSAGALRLDLLPDGIEPIVRVIDDWVTARPLGLIVEGKVGAGKVVVCGFDLTDAAASDPVSRQMRASLLAYLNSDKCQPSAALTVDQIRSLTTESVGSKIRWAVAPKANSEAEGYEVQNALDGDPNTFWHSQWEGTGSPGFPHHLAIEFDAQKTLFGFTALPRQDGNHNGWIKDYAFYVSNDGINWGEPVAQGAFSRDQKMKTVKFAAPVTARFVKLVALSGHAGAWASLAEFNIIQAGP